MGWSWDDRYWTAAGGTGMFGQQDKYDLNLLYTKGQPQRSTLPTT